MGINYGLQVYNQLEKAMAKIDKLSNTIKEQNDTIKEMNKSMQLILKENQELKLEIERLKNNNNKDSNNSSKPSGTNGFKKVQNNREKSNNKKGAVIGHKGQTMSQKDIEKLIAEEKIDEVKIVEVGKTFYNKNMKPIIKYTYDLEIKRIVTKTLYYPNKEITIPRGAPVNYGENIKTLCCLLNANFMSYDGVKEIINHITDNTISISKATLLSWNDILSKKLNSQIENIKTKLLDSLVINVDESPIKVDGEQYYIHTASNGLYTLQYITKHRSKNDIDAFGFLIRYKGIIIHDHYSLYYNYGADNAECNVHILRYLNAVSEFTNHIWSKELKELLIEMKNRKEILMASNIEKIDDSEFENFRLKYLTILNKGKAERLQDLNANAYKSEELSLLNRLIKYEHNHLLFLNKFVVPFSNNRAEADLRKVKIKQKIGKFRSETGADIYAIIRSCSSTYSKNNINLFNAFKSAFSNNPIII